MTWEGWLTFGTVVAMVLALARGIGSTDMVFVLGLTVLVTVGVLTGSTKLPGPDAAVSGFGNEALVTVAVLYVVVTGLTQTGAMERLTAPLLGRPTKPIQAQSRLMAICASMSAFLNNTPIVAMFLPVLSDLCKKTGISPSKVFLPLSYATILGGVCTLIGTSTNMVVHGLLKAHDGVGLKLFDITPVGVPVAGAGILFILLASRWLLPNRKSALNQAADPRAYTVEMTVDDQSVLAGKSIEAAGLRGLPGLYLVEIERRGRLLTAVGPQEVLEVADRLVFVGVVESVVDLQKLRGLKPATNQVFKIGGERSQRTLIEAVVSPSCPLVGKTIKEGRFRNVYDAAVIAVARAGERINKKIGEIELRAGDTLLLEAHPSFAERMRDARDFLLVSRIEGSTPPRHERAWVAIALTLAMILAAGFEWLSMLNAGLVAGMAMILAGCCSVNEARKGIDWDVLITIGASLGIGKAMDSSGAARVVAESMIGAAATPWMALAVLYLATMILTEVMSNNAAAALVFPIAMATAASLGASIMPFVIVIMVAASCGFATPIGYQTNLMVYGPGGYRFSDYLKIGIPLDLLCFAVAVGITPLVYPFYPS
jgi:di/tricarboxylate transporter